MAYFRRIFICRLYKAKALSHPPHKNPHENHARFGSQIFWGADFLQSEAQNAVNPNGLTSILTRQCEKSTFKKRVRIILVCLVWQDSKLPRFRSPLFRLRLCVHFCKALALLQISRFAEWKIRRQKLLTYRNKKFCYKTKPTKRRNTAVFQVFRQCIMQNFVS